MSRNSFTLMEVLIAVAILALAFGATLGISAQAKGNVIRARQKWNAQHSLEQATEYFLLADPNDLELPEGLLPSGFRGACEVAYVEEGLPDYALEDQTGWYLGLYFIAVYNDDGRLVAEQTVYKVVREEF